MQARGRCTGCEVFYAGWGCFMQAGTRFVDAGGGLCML